MENQDSIVQSLQTSQLELKRRIKVIESFFISEEQLLMSPSNLSYMVSFLGGAMMVISGFMLSDDVKGCGTVFAIGVTLLVVGMLFFNAISAVERILQNQSERFRILIENEEKTQSELNELRLGSLEVADFFENGAEQAPDQRAEELMTEE